MCSVCRPGIVSGMRHAAGTVRVTVELNRASDQIAGSLHDGRGAARPFDGWLELGTLLEQARRDDPARPGGAVARPEDSVLPPKLERSTAGDGATLSAGGTRQRRESK